MLVPILWCLVAMAVHFTFTLGQGTAESCLNTEQKAGKNATCLIHDCAEDDIGFPINETRTGIPCQPWKSDVPHLSNYEELGESDTDNRCFKIILCFKNGVDYPWCYTMDPTNRWDFCYPLCGNPESCLKTERKDGKHVACVIDNCAKNGIPFPINKTISGIECQPWKSSVPHNSNYKGLGWSDTDNRCFKDSEDNPWCYTMDPSNRWEFCYPICKKRSIALKIYTNKNSSGASHIVGDLKSQNLLECGHMCALEGLCVGGIFKVSSKECTLLSSLDLLEEGSSEVFEII